MAQSDQERGQGTGLPIWGPQMKTLSRHAAWDAASALSQLITQPTAEWSSQRYLNRKAYQNTYTIACATDAQMEAWKTELIVYRGNPGTLISMGTRDMGQLQSSP